MGERSGGATAEEGRVKTALTNFIRKRFTSLGFWLRKTYWKLATAKPSIFVVAVIVAAFSIFLLSGGVYDILEQPMVAIPIGTRILFYYPYTVHEQSILESMFVMTTYGLGVAGVLVMYQSTKYAYKPRQAFMMLLTGAVLILIAYFYIENLILSKLTASVSQS